MYNSNTISVVAAVQKAAKSIRPSFTVFLLSSASLCSAAAYGRPAPLPGFATTVSSTGGADGATTIAPDIIVTATRQSTQLQKTPVAVTAVSADAISEQNLITARDLAGQTPGVEIQRSGITPLTQVFFIRGIGDSDPIFDPNVAQYIDDVYLPRAINGMTDLSDVERVEVLRGPQGTLFGENADAGAIRYITKTPTDKAELNIDVGAGTFNAFNIHGSASGALIAGVLDGSLSIGHEQHDGYTYDPTIRQHVNDQDTTGGRAKLLAIVSPRLKILLSLDGTVDHSATAYYIPERPIIGGTLKNPVYGAFNPNQSYASQTPKNDSWVGGVSLKASYDITDTLTINSISSYRGFAQDPVNYNNDGQPLVPYSAADPTPVSISNNYIVYHDSEATQEIQLQGKSDKIDFSSGLYFLYEDFSSNRIGYVVSPTAATALPAYPEDQIGDTKTYNYALYVQGNYRFTDKLIGTLGARYTIESRNFRFQGLYDDFSGNVLTPVAGAPLSTPGGYAAANNFAYADDKTWYSFTPKYGVSYQFTPALFTYASVSKGFDAGGFNNRASSLATALPYNQEDVTTYELGVKSDWLHRRLRFNATAFYNAYNGLQETAAVISPVTNGFVSVRSNADRAHTEGFELETDFNPVDGLTLRANASYLKTRFDSFANAAASVVNGKTVLLGATGNALPFSPHWQLYGALDYKIASPIPGEIRLGADVTYQSSYFSDVFNYKQAIIEPQSFIDGYLSYEPPGEHHWKVTLTGHNLANRIDYQSLTWGGTPNLWQGAVNPPRTVFLKVAYTR